jgi:tRNA pseudouridine38-40 synthase
MRYFIHISYNGTGYYGWQIQANKPTIEAELERSMSLLLSENVDLTGCGRTDTGVNARNFYAHFDHSPMTNDQITDLIRRLNRFISRNIKVLNIYSMAKNDANARFDALKRTYKYFVSTDKQPFLNDFCLFFPHRIDLKAMNNAAEYLLHYEDFTSFSKAKTQVKTNICHIEKAQWTRENDLYVFEIKANRFLRNMVRAIVGTLLEVGRGKISAEDFRKIIEEKDRKAAATSVIGSALFLETVEYNPAIFNTN